MNKITILIFVLISGQAISQESDWKYLFNGKELLSSHQVI